MGFTSGLYVYPKYKDTTLKDIGIIGNIIHYEEENWAKEHFPTLDDYLKYCNEDEEVKNIPADEVIEYYKDHRTTTSYGSKYLFKEYADWCSNGSGDIHDFLSELGEDDELDKYSSRRILTKEDIGKAFNFFLDKYLECMPVSCDVKYAFKYMVDSEEEFPDKPEIKLIPCDGVEVEYEDGTTRRIDTNFGGEDFPFGLPKRYFDEWELSGYLEGIRGCAALLSEVDFENSYVTYSGGW